MPYEDDYKMWLEKSLIEMNPDWVCDGMADKEFTHKWCEENCGKDNAYIMPKCLHMYYHHIARTDRKTEPTISKYVINPQEPTNDDKCFECNDFFTCGGQCNKIEDEPQTDCAWGECKESE